MKIDGVTMPVMDLEVSYFNKENEIENENGNTLSEVIALGKRQLSFSSKGMTNEQMATLFTAVVAQSTVVITEYTDPKLNANGSGTFKPKTPTAKQVRTRAGVVKGWKNITFIAIET